MKNILIISLFLLSYSRSLSQSVQYNGLVTSLDHDTCLNKKFSVVFYIIADSSNSVVPATPLVLANLIDTMNSRFRHICVTFQSCSTVVIPQYPFNNWSKSNVDPLVTASWYTDKTINFYLVDFMVPEPANTEGDLGYAYPPPATPTTTPKDVIVMSKSALTGSFPYVFHHLGHFFGLVHTSDEIGTGPAAVPPPPGNTLSQEFADGTNCATHGDCLCDTEADSGNSLQLVDGKGQRYLTPTDNYMSLYNGICRYSQQQYNRMAYIILTKRLYLH